LWVAIELLHYLCSFVKGNKQLRERGSI
jgi:hypothetical protein